MEVVTTAAIGANITTEASGDRLGLTGMRSVKLDDALSGFRIVQVGPGAVKHRFQCLTTCEECSAGSGCGGESGDPVFNLDDIQFEGADGDEYEPNYSPVRHFEVAASVWPTDSPPPQLTGGGKEGRGDVFGEGGWPVERRAVIGGG